jgi:hypothetical protein
MRPGMTLSLLIGRFGLTIRRSSANRPPDLRPTADQTGAVLHIHKRAQSFPISFCNSAKLILNAHSQSAPHRSRAPQGNNPNEFRQC